MVSVVVGVGTCKCSNVMTNSYFFNCFIDIKIRFNFVLKRCKIMRKTKHLSYDVEKPSMAKTNKTNIMMVNN